MNERVTEKLRYLPPIELSYETNSSHKKGSNVHSINDQYDVGLLIPKSKKYIAWFTFLGEEDVCILLELNREKQVIHHRIMQVDFDMDEPHLALGTLFYGSLVSEPPSGTTFTSRYLFVIEDVLIYHSVSLRKLCFGDCLGILGEILRYPRRLSGDFSSAQAFTAPASPPASYHGRMVFTLPVMFPAHAFTPSLLSTAGYPVHHVQYRSLSKVLPYLNVGINQLDTLGGTPVGRVPVPMPVPAAAEYPSRPSTRMRFVESVAAPSVPPNRGGIPRPPPPPPAARREPVGKERAVFWVKADLQSDIYYLKHPQSVFLTDVAYIPNYKTSVFMNSLFRTIKENRNLDSMEESDDEDDFLDIRHDKYVDIQKQLSMECMYHKKFRRWIPLRVVNSCNHIV